MKFKKFVFLAFLISIVSSAQNTWAQEYKHEAGANLGTSFYLGDANPTRLYRYPGIAGGVVYRYNVNFHWAVRTNLFAGTLSGNTTDAQHVFPLRRQTSFKRTFIDVGEQIEYNFFPFSDRPSYTGAKTYTPYIFTGIGTTFATGSHLFFNVHIPIGIGFKYKLKERLNVGLEFSVRKLFGDDLDVTAKDADWDLDAPYGIKSSSLKNQDWYSLTMVFLTWDFGLRYDPCCGK